MQTTKPTWYTHGLPLLLAHQPLSDALVQQALTDLVAGSFDAVEAATFLTALRMKGEGASELAAAVRVLRTKMVPLAHKHSAVLDTCGTGGDGTGTFNISTAVALVVAACGVPVVKHGNRSVSSKSGSADVLAALGIPIDRGPVHAQTSIDTLGFAFCFAPHFHPALANVGPLRKQLGFRTIFNLLGPLLNPAAAEYQLLGVGHVSLLDPVAHALALLGTKRAFIVCGQDGLDEVTLSGPTLVRQVTGGQVLAFEWQPQDFGLSVVQLGELQADSPTASAAIIRAVLNGTQGPARSIVLANAAVGLFAIGRVADLPSGVAMAAEAIDSGGAQALVQQLAGT